MIVGHQVKALSGGLLVQLSDWPIGIWILIAGALSPPPSLALALPFFSPISQSPPSAPATQVRLYIGKVSLTPRKYKINLEAFENSDILVYRKIKNANYPKYIEMLVTSSKSLRQ